MCESQEKKMKNMQRDLEIYSNMSVQTKQI